MPRLAVQNATPRALDLVLRGSDHAVFAAQDVVAPGATWTYAFHGALVVQTLDVDVHCAADARQRGICAVAATCLRLAALALFPPVALLDLLRRDAVPAPSTPTRLARFGPFRIVNNQTMIVRVRRDDRCELALQPTDECVIA